MQISNLDTFFERHDICTNDIIYINKTYKSYQTEFHLIGDRVETKYIGLKNVLDKLPDNFVCINKGIIVNINYIECINLNVYHMKDGTVLYGRMKDMAFHRRIKEEINNK